MWCCLQVTPIRPGRRRLTAPIVMNMSHDVGLGDSVTVAVTSVGRVSVGLGAAPGPRPV